MTTINPIRLSADRHVSDEGLVAKRIAVDPFDPVALLAAVPQHKSYRLFAEPGDPLRLGVGSAARVSRAAGSKPVPWSILFTSLKAALGPLGQVGHAFFSAAFDVADPFENDGTWRGFSPVELTVPELLFERDGQDFSLTIVAAEKEMKRIEESGRALLRSATVERSAPAAGASATVDWRDEPYADAVRNALGLIADEVAEKIVVARPIDVAYDAPIDIPSVIERLHARFPGCFLFGFRPGGSHKGSAPTFLGASPERLVSVRDGRVETGAIAGTAPRGVSARMDERHANELLKSDKERREHEVVGQMIEQALEPFCSDVEREELRFLKLENVQHLWTPIHGKLLPGRSLLDVAEALHPTPAVGGEPRTPAVEAIRTIEPWRRGLYAGVCGSIGMDGSGELAVAIRSAVVDGSRARLFAGAGIVDGSEPAREVDETRAKSRAILESLEPS